MQVFENDSSVKRNGLNVAQIAEQSSRVFKEYSAGDSDRLVMDDRETEDLVAELGR